MVKAENGSLILAGSFQELFMETSRILDVMALKMSTDFNLNINYDEAIEFLLNAADAAKKDRESGADGVHKDMSKELKFNNKISAEDATIIGKIVSDGVAKGWPSKKIDKKISKYLDSKGIGYKQPKSKKKKNKKDKNQKKVDELFNPKNFPYIKPQKFKK